MCSECFQPERFPEEDACDTAFLDGNPARRNQTEEVVGGYRTVTLAGDWGQR